MVRDLNAGSVWVNAYRRIHWALPFGGFGDSGYGKDSGLGVRSSRTPASRRAGSI